MTEREYEQKRRRLERKLEERRLKAELRQLKWSWLPKVKKPSTSKVVLFVTFLICVQVVWFAERMAFTTGDTSYMYVLLGVPVSLIPVVIGYYSKSKKENMVGGITYDTTMEEIKHRHELENLSDYEDDSEVYEDDFLDGSVG